MASNYNSLGFNLMTTGENAGTWGTNTNLNLNYLRDTLGYISIAMTADRTLTIPDNSTGTYDGRAFIIECTGTLGGTRVLDIAATAGSGSSPGGSASILKPFIIFDNTTHSGDTLTFKVTGATGFALTEGSTYLCYHNGTDIINTGLGGGDVTLTGTQTLTNKTLTAPKFADGGFIADANGLEALVFGAASTAVNELKITNAATGSGPILSAVSTSTTDSNIDINVTPLGTGNVNLLGDTVQCGDLNAAATVTTNGTGDLILNTNNGTNAGDITLADGANGNIEFTNNGTGVVKFNDAAYFPEADLTFDATQDWDVQAAPVAKVTLTANVVFDAPSNSTTGQFISILCIQDGGGSNTIGWNAVFEFAADTAPTATTTGDKGDLFNFRYNGAKWLSVGTTLDLTLS